MKRGLSPKFAFQPTVHALREFPHQATIPIIAVVMLAAFPQLSTAEVPATNEITQEEAKALVTTVEGVAREFNSKYPHGLALDPPAATDKCPYFLLRAWIDVPGTASTLIGWYRVNKRNADVWEDPPYDAEPVNEPSLAAAQARLRRAHHMSDELVKQARHLPSWGADCVKSAH